MAQLTPNQIETFAKFVSKWYGSGYEEDWEDHIDEIDTTRDPFTDYTDVGPGEWSEVSDQHLDDSFRHPAVYYKRVQATKGRPRVSLCVMDFGDVRAIHQI